MAKPFKGTINVDIRDSEPDWTPFEPPEAPHGAPNVVYIVLDDVGFSAMSCYGGPVPTPNIDRIAAQGVRYTQWHTTALCSPTRSCLLTGRNHTRNSMACITEAAIGFPNASGTIPPENGMLPEILAERGWNTYLVGKWHLCPTDEMNLAATRRNWPSGRGTERFYGFLGAETNQWYPDLVYDNHPVDPPRSPEEGYHLTDDLTDKALEFIKDAKAVAPDKPFFLYYAPGACHAPHHAPREWIDRFRGQFDMGYEAIREQTLARQKDMGIVPPNTGLPPLNPIGTPETRTGPDGQPFPELDYTRPWDSLSDDEKRLFARMAEVYAGFLAHADHHIGRLLDYLEQTGQRDNTLVDPGLRQRRQRRGRPERLRQRDEVRQRRRRRPGGEPRQAGRPRRPQDLQPLPERLGDGVQHPVQDVEAVRVQRRHLRPVHHLLAGRHEGAGRDPRPVPPRDRHRAHDPRHPRRRPARDDQGPPAEPLRRGQHALQHRRRVRAVETARPSSTRCSAPAAIWHEGWKAVTTHPCIAGWGHFNDDTWELYHTDFDRAELHDLAAEHPDKLRELVALWFAEAGANGAFPLDDRSAVEILIDPASAAHRPALAVRVLPRHRPGPRMAGGQHPQPLLRDRRGRRHPRAAGRGGPVRHGLAVRRPRPLREERPAALRQQLPRQRGAEDRGRRGHPDREESHPDRVIREGGAAAGLRHRDPDALSRRPQGRRGAGSGPSSARSPSPAPA